MGRGGPGRGLMLTHALSLGEGRVFLIERNRGFAEMPIHIGRAWLRRNDVLIPPRYHSHRPLARPT